MTSFVHKDFAAGWCPSDSPLNGRPNSLLHMDGVELDQNGDLIMLGGILTDGSAYADDAHTLFHKFLGTASYRYIATVGGAIFRDNTSLITGGSATRGCFGYAFDYILGFSGAARIRDNGAASANLGQVKPSVAPTLASAGAGNLTGIYEYLQINVFVAGSYRAKSAVGISSSITLTGENTTVTAQNPTAPANEVWIFRRGGTLDQFYRVKRLTSAYNTPFTDSLTDDDAIDLDITANEAVLSINSTDLSDDILGVVGPINQRMLYFTKYAIVFGEINSPESYDPTRIMNYSDNASGTEVFVWAKKVGRNTVLVGTTHEIYALTGTFITLPDGSIDVALDSTGNKFPPIGQGADVYDGGVCYMASSGWRRAFPDGTSEDLVAINVDRIYRGNTILNTNGKNPGIVVYPYPATGPGGATLHYDCAVSRHKLYCRLPAIHNSDPTQAFDSVAHVYDFYRKTWRTSPVPYERLFAREDGALYGFDYSDNKVKFIDYQFAKTNNGTQMSIDLLFPIWDMSGPDQRKDWQTLKIKCYTGATSTVSVKYSLDDGASFTTFGTALSKTALGVQIYDLSSLAASKTFQLRINGSCDDFQLCWIGIEYEARPPQTVYVLKERFDLASLDGRRFRPRTWPIIIDTLGSNVTFTPIINGADQSTTTFNSGRKELQYHYFVTDSPIAQSIGFKLSGASPFELYQVLPPEIVHAFPMGKKFDQLGPEHLFIYGKIRKLIVRLISDSTANIPYIVYFQDNSVATGNIAVTANIEDAYEIQLGKENVGRIVRVELGPTSFVFYRYYAQIQTMKSGKDTENEWITIGVNNG